VNDYPISVEVSCFGTSMEVTLTIKAKSEEDALQLSEQRVRDNTVFCSSSSNRSCNG